MTRTWPGWVSDDSPSCRPWFLRSSSAFRRRRQSAQTGPITEQYVLFSAVTALVATLAAERPVVIVLDDLHWADRASLQLMRHVVGELRSTALLLVGTYRETDLGVGHRLTETLAALRRDIGVERVGWPGCRTRR